LPEKLKDTIAKFPAGTLQFEIGIQTWNPEVQGHISRKQNNDKAKENIRWLHENSHAHMHVDLIAGLPSETFESFGRGFDTLARLGPHEIQVGVLKRLRGTPIIRHTDAFAMRYNPEPPYNILSNTELSFADVQRISRFARFWDLIGNSGRFTQALPLVLAEAPTSAFSRFLALADWLYAETGATHQIALERLFDLVYRWLISDGSVAIETAQAAILADYQRSGSKGRLSFMTRGFTASDDAANASSRKATPARQRRHLSDATSSSD
jgi:predicted DNA-binding WGR domain protein